MNEDQKKSLLGNSQITPIAGNAVPTNEDHPLHILDNQTEKHEQKYEKFNIPQKPIRTYEMDLDEALSHLDKSQIPKKFKTNFPKTETEEPKIQQPVQTNIQPQVKPIIKPENNPQNPEYTFKDTLTANDLDKLKNYRPPEQPVIKKPEPITVKPEIKPEPKAENIRTYEGDIANALQNKQTSVSTIVIAENKRKFNRLQAEEGEPENPPSQFGKKAFMLLLSVIFILGGLAGGYYFYTKSPLAVVPVVPPKPLVQSIISPDSQKLANIASLDKGTFTSFLSKEFAGQKIDAGKITEIVPTQTVNGARRKVTGSEFISAMKFDITDTLQRSLTDQWMVGVYSSNTQDSSTNLPFIILTTDFFQNAYAGMLKWESAMPENIADIFGFREQASSTITSYYNIKGTFKDAVVKNRDVRKFNDQNGKMLFLYSFIDKNTLVITTHEEVLSALLDRIEKQTYIR